MEEKTLNILDVKGEETEALLNEDISTASLIQMTHLPSGFKGYPEGTTISYEPISLDELESLNSGNPDEISLARGVALLLKSIRCNTLNPEDLYFWDVMYIGIQRKLTALGDVRGTIEKRCPHCNGVVQKTFAYTELEFKELQAPNLPAKVVVNGHKLEFGLITVKDFLQIDAEKGSIEVFARMVKNMPYEESYKIISKATGVDIKKVKFIDKQLDYGWKPFVIKCENKYIDPETKKKVTCNHDVIVEVQTPFQVVFPENEIERDFEFEIQYG